MQVCVTRIKRKKNIFGRYCVTILSVFFVVFIGFLITFFASENKEENIFKENSFYYVYSEKSHKKSYLTNKIGSIEALGGAGVILKFDEFYYLVLGVYENDFEANEIVENNCEIIDLKILKKSTKNISKNKQRKIRQDEKLYVFFKEFNGFIENLFLKFRLFLKDEFTSDDFCSFVMRSRLRFDDLKMCNYDLMIELLTDFDLFFQKFETTKNKIQSIQTFLINMTNFKLDFINFL